MEGLIYGGNLGFKINWPSLKVGGKVTVFALFCFVFEGNFPSTSPRRAYSWKSDLWRIFSVTGFGGLYLEGLIFRILRYLRSLILIQIIPKERTPRIAKLTVAMTSLDSMT